MTSFSSLPSCLMHWLVPLSPSSPYGEIEEQTLSENPEANYLLWCDSYSVNVLGVLYGKSLDEM